MTADLIKSFDFAPSVALRSLTINGAPWFVAKDICDALGLRVDNAVRNLDDDEKANTAIEGFARGAIIVNESGLYALALRSRKPQAKAFRKWVTSVVLPSVHRDGLYIAGQETPVPEELTLPELLAQIEDIQAKVNAIKEAKLRAWVRNQEERDARRTALKLINRNRNSRHRLG